MKPIFVLLLTLFTFQINAEETAKTTMVKEILAITDSQNIVELTYEQMDDMLEGLNTQLDIQDNEKPIFDKYQKDVSALLREALGWEVLEPALIEIYSKHYTEKELRDLLAFYKTDAGQALIKKLPIITQETTLYTQNALTSIMPKMQESAMELERELQKLRAQQN